MIKKTKKPLPPGVRERNGKFTFRFNVEVIEDGQKKRKQKETGYPLSPLEIAE